MHGYPAPRAAGPAARPDYTEFVIPFRLATDAGVLSFFSTTTVFGTPVDITLAELALETFFPADQETAEKVQALGRTVPPLDRGRI